jgi:nitroimidazol reductase NimA-like FMN-containing flavoprotein (pyridoxamine 5'-phosphate oxidase superfamily)
MMRSLANDEIDRVLRAEVVGRIGCRADGRAYVVPVSYVFDGSAVYAHSRDGLKIRMMRQNPEVCFEVDHVEDLVNWHSAICWATYEELTGTEARRGLTLLREALFKRLPRELEHGKPAAEASAGDEIPVVFRLNVHEKSGREERLYWNLLPVSAAVGANPERSRDPAEADGWLSHAEARQLADLSQVLHVDDIWEAADRLSERRPADEVERSLTYQGIEPDMARRLVGFMLELRDQLPTRITTTTLPT